MNSYLRGFLSLFDRNVEIRKPMSDYEAIASDWQAIGNDMRDAIKVVMADEMANSLTKKIDSLTKKIERKMAKRENKRL